MAKQITFTQFEKKRRQILEKMRLHAAPFKDDTPEEREKRLKKARADRNYFNRAYLAHYFDADSPPFHDELRALMQIEKMPVAVAAPRGFAKSTICTFADNIYDICFGLEKFIIIISDTNDLASDFVQAIALELEQNERIKADFGDLKGCDTWCDDDIITSNGVRALARGSGQRIRGLKNGPHRPGKVVIDDFENDKNVRNPHLVKEKIKWINEAVIPSLARKRWRLFLIGTLLSPRSVLAHFLDEKKSPRWVRRKYAAITPDGKSLWPEMYPVEELLDTKETIGSISFNKEYQNDPKDEEGMFRAGWMRKVPLSSVLKDCRAIVGYVDASAKQGESDDFKAIVIMGWTGFLQPVLHAWIRRASIEGLLEEQYRLHELFKVGVWGMEEVAFQSLFRLEYQRKGESKGYILPVQFRDNLPNKEFRIGCLSPKFERGVIVLCDNVAPPNLFGCGTGDMDILEEQFIYFPSSTVKDDGPDAAEGCDWLLKQYAGIDGGIDAGEIRASGIRRVGYGMKY